MPSLKFKSYTLLDTKLLNHARKTKATNVHKILHFSTVALHNSTLDGI